MNVVRKNIKIGTRGSQLALWQANWVKSALKSLNPHLLIEIVSIKTKGDKILDVPLAKVGGKGLFVKEIEQAIITREIDLAVHSLKDMPAELPDELCFGAIPQRENPADVLISKSGAGLTELKPGARIGTSSLRRTAQLRYARPDVNIIALRGNLDTRLRKLKNEDIDAIVLAAAGVIRLQCEHCIAEYLDPGRMLPAVGQGALCIEIRKDNVDVMGLVTALDHHETHMAVRGERAFLKRLEGGCQVPIAACGGIQNHTYNLSGLVADIAGTTIIKETLSGSLENSERIGIDLAERLLDRGAAEILKQLSNREIFTEKG